MVPQGFEGCGSVQRKVFCASAPGDVYRAVSTVLGRERFWAESAAENDGVIAFVLADGRACDSSVEEAVKDRRYQLRYFDRTLTFTLDPAPAGGTDVTLTLVDDGSGEPTDAGELASLLLRLKAFVDFGADLHNHDATRTTAYVDC